MSETPVSTPGGAVPQIGMIWAQTPSGVIGDQGSMPWHLPEDFAHFKEQTRGFPVVMGRRTWDSLPERFRPLPGRLNIVVTNNPQHSAAIADLGGRPVDSLDEGLRLAAAQDPERIWIMGGGRIYREAVQRDLAGLALVTVIHTDASGDTFAPELPAPWKLSRRDPQTGTHTAANGLTYHFETHRRHLEGPGETGPEAGSDTGTGTGPATRTGPMR